MYWSLAQTTGIIPSPLSKHSVSIVGQRVYIFGGVNEGGSEKSINSTFLFLDLDTYSWHDPQPTGTPPENRFSHSAAVVDQFIYIFGGGDYSTSFNDIHQYCTATNVWTKLQPSGVAPAKRRAHTATTVGKSIIIIGGGDGENVFKDLWSFDTEKCQWTQLANLDGSNRGYHTASLIGDKIFVFGGKNTKECFGDLHIYDTSKNNWSNGKKLKSKFGHSAVTIGKHLITFGGCDGTEFANNIDVFDSVNGDWIYALSFGSAPSPRGFHTSLYYDSRMLVFGGVNVTTNFSELWILDLGIYAYYSVPL